MTNSTKIDFSLEVLSQFIDDKFLDFICPQDDDFFRSYDGHQADEQSEQVMWLKGSTEDTSQSEKQKEAVTSLSFLRRYHRNSSPSNRVPQQSNNTATTNHCQNENEEKCLNGFERQDSPLLDPSIAKNDSTNNEEKYKDKKKEVRCKETSNSSSDHNYCSTEPLTDKSKLNTHKIIFFQNLFPSFQQRQKSLNSMVHRCSHAGCTRVYAKKTHLRTHVRRHTGERPFKCSWPDCSWRFSRSDELSRHMRSHSGEKPYECYCCGKRFARSDHVNKHLKIHNRKTGDEEGGGINACLSILKRF